MKSYFLEKIPSVDEARIVLSKLLPSQSDPWILLSKNGDPIAYLSLVNEADNIECPAIQCDISGRHYTDDQIVIKLLQQLQNEIGGVITNDKQL